MATTFSTAAKNASLAGIRGLCGSGKLQIGTTGMASVLAEYTLTAGGGSETGGVWTLAFASTAATALATGTAAEARIIDSGAADVITGLAVGSEITIDNTSIDTGQTVNLTTAQLTAG